MGTSTISRNKTYLEQTEINKLISKNKYINPAFTRAKNVDGFLTIKELKSITNGLINEKILKKIIQICGSKKDKLTYDDFCYFYALLITSSFEAKLNFLLDFIFINNDNLQKNKYVNKVNKYFNGSELLTNIFLDQKLLKNEIFSRQAIYSFIEKEYKKKLENYSLYKIKKENLNKSYENININSEENDNNENTLILMNNNNSKENSNDTNNSIDISIVKNKSYEALEGEFKNIEKKNNGIFPISLFEEMLKEINVNDVLIEIIGDYLRKKTRKSFFNFEIFKEVLSLLISEERSQSNYYKEISKGLFTIISYPKNYIDKKILLNLLKNEKNIEKKLDKLEIGNHIDLKQFFKINNIDKNIFDESLEHIKYLKYIFFKSRIEDISIEFKCLEILTKGLTLEQYILERLKYDKNFYLVDIQFWKKWNKYMEEERNYNDFRKLRMNTKNFTDNNGMILEGCCFVKHFAILSETIYTLFLDWYGPPIGMNIIRHKIYLDDEENNGTHNSQIRKREKNSKFIAIDKETNKKCELELYPIFIKFYSYLNFISNHSSKKEILHKLNKLFENEDRYSSFSRKTKFFEIAKALNNMEINDVRFWIFFNGELNLAEMSNTLEDLELVDKVIILVEEKVNNIWQSDLEKDRENIIKENDQYMVGLVNIGNTCFMNSILQIFLNIEQIKNIFINENEEQNKSFLSFILNSENKEINEIVNKKGYLVLEFINLLKKKWIEENRVLNPRKFKEICGEYNSIFKACEQQDAYDFYLFLIDKFHEETNIKSRNDNSYNNFVNSETIDTNEMDLANECWANNIRKNASYFYALFMGQLKSTLICSECNTQKIKYEPFSALEIPIPEEKNIIIEIIFFRLPYSLRKFNLDNINDYDERENTNVSTMININESINLKKKNKKDKKYKNEKNYLSIEENTINVDKNNEQNKVINSLLNLNIPLRLKIEVDRKDKCSIIIEKLKFMKDLNIEKNYNLTQFIMISKGKYINEDLIIDETFNNLNVVFVYELLNYKGLTYLYDYKKNRKLKILSLKDQEIKYYIEKETYKTISTIKKNTNINSKEKIIENKNLNIPSFYFQLKENYNNKEYDSFEILIPIIHRIKLEKGTNFIPINNYQYFFNFQDFIISSPTNSIKPYHLYEMMWKKYMYFLNFPSKYDNSAWWKSTNDRKYLPFLISIINKDTSSCAFCPWFEFCTGCPLKPSDSIYLNINSNNIIVIEWDKDVYTKEINKNNFSLVMNHDSLNTISNTKKNDEDKITIHDCLKLFTKSELLNDIQCEKCKKKTLFKKNLEIEKLPTYLVIVLKRFKYIMTNSIKINNLINFPLEELSLKDYVSQKNIDYTYNLFGIINHAGTLERGHYYSFINLNGIWIDFDDSHVTETNERIVTNKVYMLVYKAKNNKTNYKNLNLLGLMDRAYMNYLKKYKFKHLFNYVYDKYYNILKEYSHNCEFYFGEPVTIDGNYGFLYDINKEDRNKDKDKINVKIKLKKGFYTGVIDSKKIIKETFKKPGNLNINALLNDRKGNQKTKENPIVCGSQVCLIF